MIAGASRLIKHLHAKGVPFCLATGYDFMSVKTMGPDSSQFKFYLFSPMCFLYTTVPIGGTLS